MGKVQVPPDSTGKIIDTSELLVSSVTVERQNVCLADPIAAANVGTVAQFHNADNQQPGGNAYGLLTGGVAQLLNVLGNIDRQRETGQDGISAVGVATGSAQFAMAFLTTDSTDNFAAGTQIFTPVAMSGNVGGVPWSIQKGTVIAMDSGANLELVLVTATTPTTFTATTTKAHNGTVTPFLIAGFVYNQERDAAGELDGASGSGTAVAAEYEYNGGGAGTSAAPQASKNFDRARNLAGKGYSTLAINSGGGAGSSSVTLASAPTGLLPGAPVLFDIAGTQEVQYTALNYAPGANPVVLANPLINSHAGGTVSFDVYSPNGPGLNGFMPTGVGIEEEALYDPVSKLFYVERAATQDAAPPQNVVLENPGFWNGTAIDRGRSASAANMTAAQTGVGAQITTPPGGWKLINAPAVNTQATATQAAGGAGVRHVLTSLTATFVAGGTAPAAVQVNVVVRDGATGVGTIIWEGVMSLPAVAGQSSPPIMPPGLVLVGSANTAMTVEFTAAGGANTFEAVSANGYDIV